MFTFSVENIKERFRSMPALSILLSIIAGIVVAAYCPISVWIWVAMLILIAVAAVFYQPLIVLALFAYGGMAYNIHTAGGVPHLQRIDATLKIGERRYDYGSYATYTATVVGYNGRECNAKITLYADSLAFVEQGDEVRADIVVKPLDESRLYNRLLAKQGFVGKASLYRGNMEYIRPATLRRLHTVVVERMERLLGQSDAAKVALNITLGAKVAPDRNLSNAYSYSGLSHLLAVSGLHAALVLMLIVLLLRPLVLLWRGNVILRCAAVVLVWLYVALCGYPTSAIRAAIMLTLLEMSYVLGREYASENSLCFAALMMLCVEPTMLFEPSFMLSFAAVAGIVFVGADLCRGLSVRNSFLRWILHSVAISTVCIAATLPIVVSCFGTISILSILLTPVVLIFVQLNLVYTLIMVVMPNVVAQTFVAPTLWCNECANRIIEWSVSLGVGYSQMSFSGAGVALYYAILIAATIFYWGFAKTQSLKIENYD